jgi:predicted phosphodiesterase
MKIAVFSDVHANLPALEAVLHDMEAHHPDVVICLGDLVNQNVWNNEVVQLIRQKKILTIKGNHDEGIGNGDKAFHFSYTSREARQWGLEAIQFTLKQITTEHQLYLQSLPYYVRIELKDKDGLAFRIHFTHGSPANINEYLFDNLPETRFRELLLSAQADVLIVGHTHRPYHKILSSDQKQGGHIINAGSCGMPKDGNWKACYGIITFDTAKSLFEDNTSVKVDFYRVAYDLDKAIKTLHNSPLSLYFASRILTGE